MFSIISSPSSENIRINPFGEEGAALYDCDVSRMPERYKQAHAVQNELVISALSCHEETLHSVVVDLGSGTANDGLEILARSTSAIYVRIDNSLPMIDLAKAKMHRRGFNNRSVFLERSFLAFNNVDVIYRYGQLSVLAAERTA